MAGPLDDIDDATWNTAFDWLMRLDAQPGDPEAAAGLAAWLAADARHRRAYDQVRRVWSAAPALDPVLAARGGARRNISSRRPGDPVLSRRRLLTAGAGAMAAGLALYVSGAADGLFADAATGTGETRGMTLADGTQVQLDTATALRLPQGGDGRRVELLRGRAFFDVAHDATRPFTVAAGPARIAVLGTRFDARLDPGRLSVAVESGRVAVDLAGRPLSPEGGLAAGQSLSLDLSARRAETVTVDPDDIAAWRRGRLVVDGWPVSQVLDELGRYHRGVILVADAAFGARRVSGYYDLTRPEEAVRSVVRAQGGAVTRLSPWVLVVSGA